MAKEEKKPEIPSFQKYENAYTAARLAGSEEGSMYVPGALENLAGKSGLNFTEDAMKVMKIAGGNEETAGKVISTFYKDFQDNKEKVTVGTFINWYDEALKGIKDADKIKAKLNKFGGEYIGKIEKDYAKSQTILKDNLGLFTEEQKKSAAETIKKYKEFMDVKNAVENYKFEALRYRAVETTRKNTLEAIAATP